MVPSISRTTYETWTRWMAKQTKKEPRWYDTIKIVAYISTTTDSFSNYSLILTQDIGGCPLYQGTIFRVSQCFFPFSTDVFNAVGMWIIPSNYDGPLPIVRGELRELSMADICIERVCIVCWTTGSMIVWSHLLYKSRTSGCMAVVDMEWERSGGGRGAEWGVRWARSAANKGCQCFMQTVRRRRRDNELPFF